MGQITEEVDNVSLNSKLERKIKDGEIAYFKYNKFSDIEKIGGGGFGEVYKADSHGTVVALKRFSVKKGLEQSCIDEFVKKV